MTDTNKNRIAVLIDAENISHNMIDDLFIKVHALNGDIVYKKAFGNWSKEGLREREWTNILQKYAISPMHIFDFTKQKNAADIQLVIYAMKLLYTKDIDYFVIVTSDSDFTPLVYSLRENNKKIFGYGSKSYSESFKNACDNFEVLNINYNNCKEKYIKKNKAVNLKVDLLMEVWNSTKSSRVNGWLPFEIASKRLRRIDPNFRLKNLGFNTLKDYINSDNRFEIIKEKNNKQNVMLFRFKIAKEQKHNKLKKELLKNRQITIYEIWEASKNERTNDGWLHFDSANFIGRQISSDFNVKNYGFKNFKSFVERHKDVKIKTVDRGQHQEYYLKLV